MPSPYRIIFANETGTFHPSIQFDQQVSMNMLIGELHKGHAKTIPQYSDCDGKVIAVYTYQDNKGWVYPHYPLCLLVPDQTVLADNVVTDLS